MGDLPSASVRPHSRERRPGPALAAGALTVSGSLRTPQTLAYPASQSPSDAWGASPGLSLPTAPTRPPLPRAAPAKAQPHGCAPAVSPSDAWAGQGPGSDALGAATFDQFSFYGTA